MKNIFRKNQVIITALAIMIVVAGYLNFSEKAKNPADSQQAQTDTMDTTAKLPEEIINDEIDDSALDLTSGDDVSDQADVNDQADVADQNTDVVNGEDATQGEDVADVPDDSKEVAANDDSVDVGEAVLANSVSNSNFLLNKRLTREQIRADRKSVLQGIIGNKNVSNENQQLAVEELINLGAIADKELSTEVLLGAKGYDGAFVMISEGKANVVVPAKELSKQQIVQIESAVKEGTGLEAKDIIINPVNEEK